MTPREATEVLKMAARSDKRTIGVEDIKLWCTALTKAEVSCDEALAAVIEHYTNTAEWCSPAHVVAIVRWKHRRKLDHSWRLEAQALATVDPDDPAATADALRRARQTAAAIPEAVPDRPALPSRFEPDEDRADRAHRGATLCREALAGRTRERRAIAAEPASESERIRTAALSRATAEPRDRRTDPSPLARLAGQTLHTIRSNR